jgi:hypothetical protein
VGKQVAERFAAHDVGLLSPSPIISNCPTTQALTHLALANTILNITGAALQRGAG